MAPRPCKQYFVMFSEGLKLSSRSDIYTTWGMARVGLSGSEPGADLSAWLAKIMARLSGSTAPSWAVYITSLYNTIMIKFSKQVPYLHYSWCSFLTHCSDQVISRLSALCSYYCIITERLCIRGSSCSKFSGLFSLSGWRSWRFIKGYAKKKSATQGCFIWLRPPRHPPPPPCFLKRK